MNPKLTKIDRYLRRVSVCLTILFWILINALAQNPSSEVYLGRIKVINRSKEVTSQDHKLIKVSPSYSFKVNYKIEDNSKAEPFSTRASVKLKEQITFGVSGGEDKWNYVWDKSESKETLKPWDTYKKEGSFMQTFSMNSNELVKRYHITLKGESGRLFPKTASYAFTVARAPIRGGDLLIHAIIANQTAKGAYLTFSDLMNDYADGSMAQIKLEETMRSLQSNSRLFIEHYDIYQDPSGNSGDIVILALEGVVSLFNIAIPVSEVWMLMEYSTLAVDLINDVTTGVTEANNASLFGKGMKKAQEYLNYCNVNPIQLSDAIVMDMKSYGYDRTLDVSTLAIRLANRIQRLQEYSACLQAAYDRFEDEVEKWPDFQLLDRQKVLNSGKSLFEQLERDVLMHAISLETLRLRLIPNCGDGICVESESCSTCPSDCCKPQDQCFRMPNDLNQAANFSLDYRDDIAVKNLYISKKTIEEMARHKNHLEWRLTMIGKAFGTYNKDQEGIVVSVNGQVIEEFWPHRRLPVDRYVETDVIIYPIKVIQPIIHGLDISLESPFQFGWNTITLRSGSHWNFNGLRIAIDTERDCDRSAWDNNNKKNPTPASCTGEMMIAQQIQL